jgi:site-specific DNA-methyltransferase (adenine-specific)
MIPFPNKKYNIIYADPAWHYDQRNERPSDNITKKYSTMKMEDIYKLPVNEIADKNCLLFLWVTYPKLIEGLKTIDAWGFKYITCAFSWIKKNKKSEGIFFGLGNWTRANNEICLLGKKGTPKRKSAFVAQVVIDNLREHSRKPDRIRNDIVELCGDLPRIELFARQKAEGWDSWGNEL